MLLYLISRNYLIKIIYIYIIYIYIYIFQEIMRYEIRISYIDRVIFLEVLIIDKDKY